MSRLIILDRDGVINQDSDNYIKSVAEFIPIPGSLEAIARLCQAGYSVMVASNQSGIARQYFSLETLNAMHDKLQSLLAPLDAKISGFYFCPHGPDDHCDCRKPQPGLINQIAHDFFTDATADISQQLISQQLTDVFMVGDSLSDLKTGRTAGTKIALVKTGKGLRSLKAIAEDRSKEFSQLPVYNDLADFTQQLLET
ncbi:D-glycero-beta-D-manno-heptose 1,7-bisphosphate 7-phosphatase [sulfur-oxidizing endosymbiont of Gigantopelta aegis]|uniref:D-glycero-beta-D-manno-heptose 1,7-bisphosphate 7-phosphatase n=1 Tax=sulfur-oxidizing endosymbiont of Gigantopelta aegis TaxID=2794934 RepID=UPI0018DCAAF0|nr:D-glycero-beta-D-manno-heptose 1,7-bisphosphate 7-phosphatase [sulfur-oxidizing endosymbiont of Gigantopelta aegis]